MTVFRNFEVYGFVRKFCAKNPPERKAANRCVSYKKDHHTFKHIWFLPIKKANVKKPKKLALSSATK